MYVGNRQQWEGKPVKYTNQSMVFSPSDLVQFMESPFATWMQRLHLEQPAAATPDEPTEEAKLIARTGNRHEEMFLSHLKAEGRDVCTIERSRNSAELTRAALKAGREVIYQGALECKPFAGFADFLVRDEAGQYEVWDTKLARKSKPYHIVQLCCYAEMLGHVTGYRPETVRVVLGNNEVVPFRTGEFFHFYLELKAAFLEQMNDFTPDGDPPLPDQRADHRQWTSQVERWLDERDHLVRVAGITIGQIAKLERAGVRTLANLAASQIKRIPKLNDEVFTRLKSQADIQNRSRQQGDGSPPLFSLVVPAKEVPIRGLALLPPASPMDVFFDIEGYPLVGDGLEYLLGATHLVEGKPEFMDWWAHDEDQEKAAFQKFVDWAYARWREDRSMHIYHYAPYEVTAMRRLMGKYATREEEIDTLQRNGVFVDLYRIVRQGLLLGADSYSLKQVEKLYRQKRKGDVQTAAGSIVYYGAWLDSGEPVEWSKSEILRKIRDYNKEDCESTWELTEWLRRKQSEAGICWSADANKKVRSDDDNSSKLPEDVLRRMALAERLLATIPTRKERESLPKSEQEHITITELFGQLVEFHRRESKPVFWAKYERIKMSEEDLFEDISCLAGLQRKGHTPQPLARSVLFSYTFDPNQDTKIAKGDTGLLAQHPAVKIAVEELDREQGTAVLKISPSQLKSKLDADTLPIRLSLIPDEFVSASVIEAAIERRVNEWEVGNHISPLLRRLLTREPPSVTGHTEGESLVRNGESALEASLRVVSSLRDSSLIMQGPPGCGKTYTASHLIVDLLNKGKNIGVVSNSHKAILNLLSACSEVDPSVAGIKCGGGADPFFAEHPGLRHIEGSQAAIEAFEGGLLAGTAWLFSREELEGRFDYLFVDEAGQVSLANLVGMSACTKNIVLLGDQMQLSQPVQGHHPGETGSSALTWLLGNHATVPPDRGIFLETSWRMHPDVCRFISETVYEGRLHSAKGNECQMVRPSESSTHITRGSGILFHPVSHVGNTQASDEEAEAVRDLANELLRSEFTDRNGKARLLRLDDILFVAPYNMQVRRLQEILPRGARVGSVDRFQGQEAPVVILSLCSSAGEFGSRGLGFVLDRNRLNVAISRAQSLAIVVADPKIAQTPGANVEDMRRINLFCKMLQLGTSKTPPCP